MSNSFNDDLILLDNMEVIQFLNPEVQFNKNFFTGMVETKERFCYLCFDRGWRIQGGGISLKDFREIGNI